MTRDEMEARRLEARGAIIAGYRPSKVARIYGVTRTTVSRWVGAVKAGGDLRKRKATGRPPRVSVGFVRSIYQPGMRYAVVANIIGVKLGVSISENHVGRLLHKAGVIAKPMVKNKNEAT